MSTRERVGRRSKRGEGSSTMHGEGEEEGRCIEGYLAHKKLADAVTLQKACT